MNCNVNIECNPNRYLPIKSQEWEHQNDVQNLFKVANKDTSIMPLTKQDKSQVKLSS